MNERIRELKAKALVPIQKDGYTSWVFSEEKFAELIIERCATVADFAHLGGVVEPGVMIKEYFGVE